MTEKTPDFVKRVRKKFLPISISSYDYSLEFPKNEENQKRLEALGVNISDRGTFQLGSLNGKPVEWNYYYYSDFDNSVWCPKGVSKSEHRCVQLFGIKEWTHCRDFYKKKYDVDKKNFESQNPIWKQLQELNSPEMKAVLSESERNAMKNLYEAKLKKDPNYQSLQELKKDIFDLDTYVKYIAKAAKSSSRRGFKERLSKLKAEYDSGDVKGAIPDEKRRLSARGVMHKKLKKEAEL
ncbi:MAG: hypothetical protein IKS41_07355 [Alphaproteobacteria bacterium]|nr:hypothetical protein [Alphaproteobacteria bacterium]